MPTESTLASIDTRNYRFLQEHIYSESGLVLDGDKHYLLENRLAPVVRQHGLDSINDLCALLQATSRPDLRRQVAEAMTTNETYFFRDPVHYDAIRSVLLPALIEERRDTKRLRFWSAASSTGQEAYSLAMLLHEEGLSDWNVQILGTDFSSEVLERATAGRYQQIEMNRGLPARLLLKHFRRCGAEWELNEPVRRMTRFEPIDLRKSMRSLGPFDLVFCRNVLIYFDDQTKRNILKEIHSTLFRGGWLLLGGAETVFNTVLSVDTLFEKRIVAGAIVYVAR